MVDLTNIPNFMERIRYALMAANEERFCPPDNELLAAGKSDQLQRHLDNCESCRDRLEAFIEMGYTPHDSSQQTISARQEPASGELWTLRRNLAGWDDSGRYFNTPTILVLNIQDDRTVLAAQICNIEELAYEGDLLLGAPYSGFVEPWNTKLIPIESLGRKVGEVSTDLVKTACEYEETLPVETLPVLIEQFRRQEREVADYIESKSGPLSPLSHLTRLFAVPADQELHRGNEDSGYALVAATTTLETSVPRGEGSIIASLEWEKGEMRLQFHGLDSYGSIQVGLHDKTLGMAIPIGRKAEEKVLLFTICPGTAETLYFDIHGDDKHDLELVTVTLKNKD